MKTTQNNHILEEDMAYIFKKLSSKEKTNFYNSKILITGCGGFLGYYFINFFKTYIDELCIDYVVGIDNFITGSYKWLDEITKSEQRIKLHHFDIIRDDLNTIAFADRADFIIHGASIASPTYYRMYPIETVDANVTGLRRLLDYYSNRKITGMLFFSSSEIYGDPLPNYIPTNEDYRGNVPTMGPRACYDEAKRFGETLCYIYNKEYGLPVSIARPFNNYGPGMSITDKRLPADFAKCVIEGSDLIILSNGKPTRTFCYIADAIVGYLKVLLFCQTDTFNIGIDKPEVSVIEFAKIFQENARRLFNYDGKLKFVTSEDLHYLTDNPNRRCPDITKAKTVLSYDPQIYVNDGVGRYLEFLKLQAR